MKKTEISMNEKKIDSEAKNEIRLGLKKNLLRKLSERNRKS